MTFSDQYLTYSEYQSLGGTLLEPASFNLYEFEARNIINDYTLGRIKKEIPNEVKICMFKLINGIAFDGGYKDANTDEKIKYIYDIVYNCLLNVKIDNVSLLYRGI